MGSPRVLVLGIGNLLWADEGFGVRAVEALHRDYDLPDNVRLMDGGTQGLYLVDHVRNADILVVFDAVDYGLPPGTIKLVEDDEVPKFLGAKKISLHQTGFQEVLATAELLGGGPGHLLLVGVQPVELEDFGGSLREATKDRIAPAISHALDYLARFGVTARLREVPRDDAETLACRHMVMSRYEDERPSDEEACRSGDARVLAWTAPDAADADARPEDA
ncbi:HyaD/HybD family hydrogenase maturation endopeptidase [Bradyrhizobium sp. WD16]|uniref:HyaD/HybD family hydrogenase maturation endopeptidase n=1 Tax=Bradyrhizobium sp. WD16 TaxID=1521768 RepID=UPI0020A37EF3|nr:HyaD/HybD family hydrogenase maturation endopeptidase [Bradyrhizobium sp. WD16]UTD26254.1 HyaD/HybD family hydrogenase maturation endopeptidase [Bradyrhizobium sp. WD16]